MLHIFAKRMREIHENDRKGQKGFTLIELLVVTMPSAYKTSAPKGWANQEPDHPSDAPVFDAR